MVGPITGSWQLTSGQWSRWDRRARCAYVPLPYTFAARERFHRKEVVHYLSSHSLFFCFEYLCTREGTNIVPFFMFPDSHWIGASWIYVKIQFMDTPAERRPFRMRILVGKLHLRMCTWNTVFEFAQLIAFLELRVGEEAERWIIDTCQERKGSIIYDALCSIMQYGVGLTVNLQRKRSKLSYTGY